MVKLVSLVCLVLGFLLVERLTVLKMVRCEAGRQWIRRHKWFHPNPICIYRIPMGLISCWMWYAINPETACIWFAFWMLTDMTDGTIARGCQLGTPTGEWLDPLSDKCMYIPLLILFAYVVPENQTEAYLSFQSVLWFTIIDVIGQFSRLFSKKKAANSFGKAKTTMVCTLMIFTGLKFTCYDAFMSIPLMDRLNLDFLMWACAVLSFLSFYCKVIPDSWYANSLTFMNFMCGLIAIYLSWNGQVVPAFVMIFMGQFFDLLDGRCARKFGSTRFGALFDDIADGTSFGIAIGLVIFRILHPIGSTNSWVFPALVGIFYSTSVIYRLYRFLKNSAIVPRGIFQGLPSPAGAMLVGSGTILFKNYPMGVYVVTILGAALMISKIPYKHFGEQIWGKLPSALKLTFFIVILAYTTIALRENSKIPSPFALWCFAMTIIYLVFGLQLKREKNS